MTSRTHRSPQWMPVLDVLAIPEENNCICEGLPCECQDSSPVNVVKPFEDFDGIDDILAVSQVPPSAPERVGGSSKKRQHPPPLLRARTLPAIITPSLNILQAQLDPKQSEKQDSDEGLHLRDLSSSVRRRAPSDSLERHRSFEPSKWKLMVDESSPYKSPTLSPRHSVSSTSSTSSHHSQSGSTSFFKSSKGETASKAGLSKLARLLTPKDRSVPEKNGLLSPGPEVSCFSWSRETGTGSLRRSGSIDSLLEPSVDDDHSPEGITLTVPPSVHRMVSTSPSLPPSASRPGAIPSSPSMPSKLAKNLAFQSQDTENARQEGKDGLEVAPLSKTEKKKMEKLNKYNIDLQALFAAVENHHLDRAADILETADFDINSVNGDGLTTLDIAVLTRQTKMVNLLQSYGAQESDRFSCPDERGKHLHVLLMEAERCVSDLSSCVLASTSTNGSLSAALLKEKERQLYLWQRRLRLLKQMKQGYDQIRVPDPPTNVQLEVIGNHTLKIKFAAPKSSSNSDSLITKYKVEWSQHGDFHDLSGQMEVANTGQVQAIVIEKGVTKGVPYYVRVAAGNLRGFGPFRSTQPSSATPSSWRDVEGSLLPRAEGRLSCLARLFLQVVNARPPHSAEVKYATDFTETPQQQRRQMRKSIKNLFTTTPKFQKNMKRGVFLACLVYSEDKILVAEDTLPILEVDETYPASSLHTDFHWLMKVACTWEDVKTLRQDMEKSHSSSNVHFRSKILQTVEQMQGVLGTQNLGQLYYRPLKDAEGTVVFVTVRHIIDPKGTLLPPLSMRWAPITRVLQRKMSGGTAEIAGAAAADAPTSTVNDILMALLKDMIKYHESSTTPLPRGLYLGYVKLKSSVDLIRLMVPGDQPNVLPYVRIRENPHVSREEWEWFKALEDPTKGENTPTKSQLRFQKSLSSAVKNLFSHLDIPESEQDSHRLYNTEVVELSKDVAFLLLLPPVENVCSVPGQSDGLTTRQDCIPLPVQVFEIIHMTTYHQNFINLYSRISSILEMDTLVAQHAHREAFSSSEVAVARSRLTQLQEFQSEVDNTWRGMRWIMDAITFARDKQCTGLIIRHIWCDLPPSPTLGSPVKPTSESPTSFSEAKRIRKQPVPKKQHLRVSNSSHSFTKTSDKFPCEIRRSSSTSKLDCSSPSAEVTAGSQKTPERKERRVKAAASLDLDSSISNALPHLSVDHTLYKHPSLNCLNNPYSTSTDVIAEDPTLEDILGSEGIKRQDPEIRCPHKTFEGKNSSIIRVYAAYDCGLPEGTSLKMQCTPETTAKEVVELVVKQLNMAALLKGHKGPVYNACQMKAFHLYALLENELRLDDDFPLVSLNESLSQIKFFVRMDIQKGGF